jgi:thioredoxin reductase (NADPH)
VRQAHVSSISYADDMFVVETDSGTLFCRYVLLATGVRDHLPDLKGASEAVMRSLLRICPICDAFEAIDKRIAVIGDGPLGEREASFLRHYTKQVTLLQLGSPPPSAKGGDGFRIERLSIELCELHIQKDRVALITAQGERDFDVMYLALGCSAQNDLARSLMAECDEHGALQVNAHQETSVPGLYAAGDVVRGLNQVVVAAAESAIAATDIHNKLRALSSPVSAH